MSNLMYRLNLQLPDEVEEALKASAKQRDMTISALVRRLIVDHLNETGHPVNVEITSWGGRRKKSAERQKRPSP